MRWTSGALVTSKRLRRGSDQAGREGSRQGVTLQCSRITGKLNWLNNNTVDVTYTR